MKIAWEDRGKIPFDVRENNFYARSGNSWGSISDREKKFWNDIYDVCVAEKNKVELHEQKWSQIELKF